MKIHFLAAILLSVLSVHGTPVQNAPREESSKHGIVQLQARDCLTGSVQNGDFETGSRAPWVIPRGSVAGYVKAPGSNYSGIPTGKYSMHSDNMIDNNLFTVEQTLNTCPGFLYTCSYDWYFDAWYATKYKNGNIYVPYIHTYVNYDAGNTDAVGVRSLYKGQGKQWQRNSFTFTASGSDILEFDMASPQPIGQGCNYARIDNVYCVTEPT